MHRPEWLREWVAVRVNRGSSLGVWEGYWRGIDPATGMHRIQFRSSTAGLSLVNQADIYPPW